MTESLLDTIKPKSDQLNADDLIAGPITVTVTAVKRGATNEQPVIVEIDGGHQPYKPCKSMRRVLISAWGDNGRDWVGKRMTLYADPSVVFGGVRVGGIRISHVSGITEPLNLLLTTTRSKRATYTVEPLAMYPEADFAAKLPAMRKAIADGKMTVAQVIERCRKTGELTAEQAEALTRQEAAQ